MKEILSALDNVYQNKKYKLYYTILLSGFTIICIVVIPFFIKRSYIIGTLFFDLFIRVFLTFNCCQSIYYVSHLDEAYARFYRGAKNLPASEPDLLRQIINIIFGILVGFAGYFIYKFSLDIFAPFLGKTTTFIALGIGILTSISLLSQYNKPQLY
jgi:hypothetical protein